MKGIKHMYGKGTLKELAFVEKKNKSKLEENFQPSGN